MGMGMGMGAPSSSAAPPPVAPAPLIMTSPQKAAEAASPTIQAFDKAGLRILMTLSKPNPSDLTQSRIVCAFNNQNAASLDNFVFQVRRHQKRSVRMFNDG
jgi:hypothetical protein